MLSLESLRQAVEHAGFVAAGIGFLAGLVFSFNPVAVTAIPVSLAYVTKARTRPQAVLFGAMFIAGMVLTHVLLGLIAGLGGRWVEGLFGRGWGLLLGPLLIVLGLVWPGWIRFRVPALALRARRPSGPWGAFALGVPFSIAICPVCTPALVVVLGVVASIGSPLLGAVVLSAFALGRAIPVALGAWSIGWLKSLGVFTAYRGIFEAAGGVILIASGLYLLNAYFFWIPALAG
jgi:cytochrome c-type biogenesis protein